MDPKLPLCILQTDSWHVSASILTGRSRSLLQTLDEAKQVLALGVYASLVNQASSAVGSLAPNAAVGMAPQVGGTQDVCVAVAKGTATTGGLTVDETEFVCSLCQGLVQCELWLSLLGSSEVCLPGVIGVCDC